MPTEQKVVPTPDFDKLWEEVYSKNFAQVAKAKAGLIEGEGTAEDLFQDLWLNVWRKVVSGWPTYVQRSSDPKVEAWVGLLLKRYLVDVWRKSKTGPRQFGKGQVSLESPVRSGEEGEEETSTLEDFVGALDKAFSEVESDADIDLLLNAISDPSVRKAVEIIVTHSEPPDELWARIRRETGHSRSYLQQKIRRDPTLIKFLQERNPGFKAQPVPPQAAKEGETTASEHAVVSSLELFE